MAQAAIPDEINRHVEAVLVLSKRDILLRLVREAELCVGLEQVRTAVTLAGIALEEFYHLNDQRILRKYERNLGVWRELRDRSTHAAWSAQGTDADTVTAILTELRTQLEQMNAPESRQEPSKLPNNEFATIRGKYAFVATSVDDFLKRKREDLELENQE